jgi:hypothetical protein
MNKDSVYDLLQDGVPNPPSELMTPPMASIRRRAHRRRLVTGVSTAAALLIMAGVGVRVINAVQSGQPPVPGGGPSASAGPWIFAVVGADDRSLVVVREGTDAGEACPGTSPDAFMPLPGTVGQQTDRVVLPMPALAGHSNCMYQMPVHLDAPLGSRAVISGADNAVLPVLPVRILPQPTYPAGISLDTTLINVVGNAPRPLWVVGYHRPDGLAIRIEAMPADMVPTLPAGEQLQAHGHDMQIQSLIPGKNNIVSWTDRDWQVSVTVDPADHGGVTRAELQRIIEGLVWP